MRAFDEAGNIGQHEGARIDGDDAEAGGQRREGIVGDLRLCRAYRGEEGRLACIGQADKSGIRDQLQPQHDGLFLAFEAGICAARCLIGGALEIGVAEAAIAALGEQHPFARFRHVGDQRFFVFLEDLRAHRNFQHDIGPVRAGAVLAHAVHAGLGLEVLLETIVDERVQPFDAFGDDTAAPAAIAAIRSAELDEFLAAKAHRARAAIA